MRFLAFCTCVVLTLSSAVSAATLNESDIPGGFSSDFSNPTQIAGGFEDVVGELAIGGYDIFSLANLAPGEQTVSLTFSLPPLAPGSSFQNAGGYVRFQETPFAFSPEEGSSSNFALVFNPSNPSGNVLSQTLSFDLDGNFTGSPLFFSVRSTFSSVGPLSFGVNAPGNALAPVPLPATGMLLLTALLGSVAFRRWRNRPANGLVPAQLKPSLIINFFQNSTDGPEQCVF